MFFVTFCIFEVYQKHCSVFILLHKMHVLIQVICCINSITVLDILHYVNPSSLQTSAFLKWATLHATTDKPIPTKMKIGCDVCQSHG